MLRFYAVYRALVRAKVAAIRQTQQASPCDEAMRLIALAHALGNPPKPRLIITHGLSGCGKTTLSNQLLQSRLAPPTVRLRSDIERKRLFGLAPSDHSGANIGLYSPNSHGRTYARLQQLSETMLRAGWSVVVDATFLHRTERQLFQELARRMNIGFAILAPQASPEQLQQRVVARRTSGHDASDADLSVLQAQIRSIEALDAPEQACLLNMDEWAPPAAPVTP